MKKIEALTDNQQKAKAILQELYEDKAFISNCFPNRSHLFFTRVQALATSLNLMLDDFDTEDCLYIFGKINGSIYECFDGIYDNVVARFLIYLRVVVTNTTFFFVIEFDEYIRQAFFTADERLKIVDLNRQRNTRSDYARKIKNTLNATFFSKFLNKLQLPGSLTISNIFAKGQVSSANTLFLRGYSAHYKSIMEGMKFPLFFTR